MVKLDLPAGFIPAGCRVDSAYLHMYLNSIYGSPGTSIRVTQIQTAWNVGTAANILWANSQPASPRYVDTIITNTPGDKALDITSIFQDWYANDFTNNYGVAVSVPVTEDTSYVNKYHIWRSMNYAASQPTDRPYIEVNYTDITPPSIVWDTAPADGANIPVGVEQTFNATGTDNVGITSWTLALDGVPKHISNVGTNLLCTPDTVGNHTVTIIAIDAAGNQSNILTRTYNVIDQVAPVCVWDAAPANGAEIASGIIQTLSVDVSDNISVDHVVFKVDGVEVQSGASTTYNWTPVAGTHTIEAVAYDTAGNNTSTGVRTITVLDTSAFNPLVLNGRGFLFPYLPGPEFRLVVDKHGGLYPVITVEESEAPADEVAPIISGIEVSLTRISDEPGKNQCVLTFQVNEDIQEWEVRAGGGGPGQGTLVESGGAALAGSTLTAYVDWNELGADGTYRLNVYAKDMAGNWTPYDDQR